MKTYYEQKEVKNIYRREHATKLYHELLSDFKRDPVGRFLLSILKREMK